MAFNFNISLQHQNDCDNEVSSDKSEAGDEARLKKQIKLVSIRTNFS